MDARIPDVTRQANRDGRLAVNEIFQTIQGETTRVGEPCVILRLTGCPLRCSWCDTTYAYDEGALRDVADVVADALAFPARLVAVTGGEPLAQRATLALLTALCDAGRTVLLETSGALDITRVDPRVCRIVDVKCPGSGMQDRNRWQNLEILRPHDEVKFVLASRLDYEYARDVVRRHDLAARCPVLFGPVSGAVDPRDLAAWILEDALAVRLQLQIHKIVWEPGRRGV